MGNQSKLVGQLDLRPNSVEDDVADEGDHELVVLGVVLDLS